MGDQNLTANLRARECLHEISASLRGEEIIPHLLKSRLLGTRREGEFLLSDSVTEEEKTGRLLSLLEEKPDGYCQFIQCLQDETQHLGHSYLAALLAGSEFASDDVISASGTVKERMVEMTDSMKDLDIDALVPFLRREELLTESELDLLLSANESRHKKILDLLLWLDTKGPTAHYLFARCLRDETTHPTHKELFNKLTIGLSPQHFDKPAQVPHLISKLPVQVKLKTAAYRKKMQKLRRLHLDGKWDEADLFVDECVTSKARYSVDARTAILLESCTGWITRRRTDKVYSCVEEARKMIKEIVSNNSTALQGRCEWALAKLYRYLNKNEKALEHIEKAMVTQFFIEDGEDKALTSYCYGSIQLAFLAKKFDSETVKKARTALDEAITSASREDYGLDLSHPRIRLAQACLGSSSFCPGTLSDSASVASARSALAAVDVEALAPRSKCIYLFTQSDIYKNEGNMGGAFQTAKSALCIAERNGFETELTSIEERLKSLNAPQRHPRVDLKRTRSQPSSRKLVKRAGL